MILGLNASVFRKNLEQNAVVFARAVAACAPGLLKAGNFDIVSVSDPVAGSYQTKRLFHPLATTSAVIVVYTVTYKNVSAYKSIVATLRSASVGASGRLASSLRSFGGVFATASAPVTEPSFSQASLVVLHSPQPSSQPTSMPSTQPSRQPSMQPSITPSSQPSCGLGSVGLPGKCGECQPGYFSSVLDDLSCTSCPIGLYSDEVKATSCKTCQWPSNTMSKASSTCDAFCICLTSTWKAIIYSVCGLIFFIFLSFARDQALSLFAIAVFATLDVASDLLYMVSERFYDVNLWYLGTFFMIFPNYPLFVKMYELSVRPRSIISFFGYSVIWLGVKNGRATINNADLPTSISFQYHDSIVKVCVYLMTWVVLVIAQILWVLFFIMVCCLNSVFLFGFW